LCRKNKTACLFEKGLKGVTNISPGNTQPGRGEGSRKTVDENHDKNIKSWQIIFFFGEKEKKKTGKNTRKAGTGVLCANSSWDLFVSGKRHYPTLKREKWGFGKA